MPPLEKRVLSDLVLIDTSAWICHFSRRNFQSIKQAVSYLLDENRAAITGPVITELIQGCRTNKEKQLLEDMMSGIHYLPVKDKHWHKTADLSFDLRRKEITVATIDALIGTVAMEYGCRLLHNDTDFDLIAKYEKLMIYNLI